MQPSTYAFLRGIIVALAILSIVDVASAALVGSFFSTGYFSGKSISRIVSDLAFVEGAAIFFIGGLLAFFHSSLSRRAIALLILGACLIGLSVLFGVFS